MESCIPLNELRKRLFERYDAHYLRGNTLTNETLSAATYEEHVPDYEASYGHIVSELAKGSRVLDLGCGIGFLLFWLESTRPGSFYLTGVDVSEPQLALARRYLPSAIALAREEAAMFLEGSARSFNAVFCTDVLEHIETEDELLHLLELVKGSLVPGGIFVCQVPNMANLASTHLRYIDLTHARGFTDLSLLQLLECAGFRECRIVRRRAADITQWIRMTVEHLLHRVIYRICGIGDERHFGKVLIGTGKA
jgi:2-polyprenyl-3-methyl-5-hydroxy-6-metoxy-1,4-benzoquinol methylase